MKQQAIYLFAIILPMVLGACGPSPEEEGPSLDVPADYATIQAAIDAAEDGETVVVSPGTYVENIDFKGKNITVRSTDPGNNYVIWGTIIDGGGEGHVVTFQSGETAQARLAGVTITNGTGGIRILDSSPIIEGNNIVDNTAGVGRDGGGISVENSSPKIEDNLIRDNVTAHGGGGIAVSNSSPIIERNSITNNTASLGGGILVSNSSPIIEGNSFSDNTADFGGGILVSNSSAIIEGNSFFSNTAEFGGGIAVASNSSPTVVGNEFEYNIAKDAGGAIWVSTDSTLVLNDPDDNTYSENKPDALYYEE